MRGAALPASAPRIVPGTYTDTIKRGEKKHYSLTLDDRSSAYLSAVAAPAPGTRVTDYADALKIDLRDGRGRTCGRTGRASYRGHGMAYPVADYAARRIDDRRTVCQGAGSYLLVVEREGKETRRVVPGNGPEESGVAADATAWPIELAFLLEPGLKGAAPERPSPGAWSTQPPAAPTGTPAQASGGTGFNDAGAVGGGVWRDEIVPGRTRFYRVPVDWGQRLNVSAELPAAAGGRKKFLTQALGLSVFNPARGAVGEADFVPYDGRAASARAYTAPVEYGNRFHAVGKVAATSLAGWYYLGVSLHPEAARYFPDGVGLTLRVGLEGRPEPAPAYSRKTDDFSVGPRDRALAGGAPTTSGGSAPNRPLRVLGWSGIGVGVLLLVGLGSWTVVARRRR
ncbi:hypothetical protein [Streptomyces sp. NPDC003077]|uniref:hypothetical protein n=1 Tax=Streptomyces sp. NPDC003077 TaxID=3154443 RepID=UPI0033A91A82